MKYNYTEITALKRDYFLKTLSKRRDIMMKKKDNHVSNGTYGRPMSTSFFPHF